MSELDLDAIRGALREDGPLATLSVRLYAGQMLAGIDRLRADVKAVQDAAVAALRAWDEANHYEAGDTLVDMRPAMEALRLALGGKPDA